MVMMNPSSMFSGVESTCPTSAIDCFDELIRKIWRKKDGVAGTFDYGDLTARMQRLNESVGIKPTMQRKPIRILQNPNSDSSYNVNPRISILADGVAIPTSFGEASLMMKPSSEKVGLKAVLKGGPWMIKNSPIILKKWSMTTSLMKEELTCILIWVKLHDVPLQGRSGFARCLIEVDSYDVLKDSLTIGVPLIESEGFSIETIRQVVNKKHNNPGGAMGNMPPKGGNVNKGVGRSGFARCLIEVDSYDVLKDSLTIGVPLIESEGFSIETIRSLVKERFSSIERIDDKERTLWVELKRLFEPDTDDTLWKLQRQRNRYFHAGRERISIVKRGSDFDVG
nr:hypothetical protein [Tanacetum cinerariifolium]